MRYPVTFFLLFLGSILLSLLLAPIFIDMRSYRADIMHLINERFKMEIEIVGPIEFQLVPKLMISLSDVGISSPDIPYISAEKIDIQLDFFALLQGKLSDKHINLDKAHVTLDINQLTQANGKLFSHTADARPYSISWKDSIIYITGIENEFILTHMHGSLNGNAAQDYTLNLDATYKAHEFSASARFEDIGHISVPITFALKDKRGQALLFSGIYYERGDISGEVNYYNPHGGKALFADFGIEPIKGDLSFDGLIFITKNYITGTNLQLNICDQNLSLATSLPWAEYLFSDKQDSPVRIQLNGDRFDLQCMVPHIATEDEKTLWQGHVFEDIFHAPQALIDVAIDRVVAGDKTIRDLSLRGELDADKIKFNHLSADLPFETRLLGEGDMRIDGIDSEFNGTINLASRQATDFVQWSAQKTGLLKREAAFPPSINFSRLNFLSDISISPQKISFTDFLGEVDEIPYVMDFGIEKTDTGLVGFLDVEADYIDLAEWGLLSSVDSLQRGRTDLFSLPVEYWIDYSRADDFVFSYFKLNVNSADFNVGAVRFGAGIIAIEHNQEALVLEKIAFTDYDSAGLELSGKIKKYDEWKAGDITIAIRSKQDTQFFTPIAALFAPFPLNMNYAGTIDAHWHLSAPDDAAFPHSRLSGKGEINNTALRFDLTSQSRMFTHETAGVRGDILLSGETRNFVHIVGMEHTAYAQEQSKTRAQLVLETQGNDITKLKSNIHIGHDYFQLTGRLSPAQSGRRFEGSLEFSGKNAYTFLPFESYEKSDNTVIPVSGHMQILWVPQRFSFSALDIIASGGTISGEGIIAYENIRPLLTANLLLKNIEISPFLPKFDTRWSPDNMSWPLLDISDAAIELSAHNMMLGKLPIDTLTAQLNLVDGIVEAKQIEADSLGGKIGLDILLEGGKLIPSFSLTGNATGIETALFWDRFYGQSQTDGAANMTFKLDGRGYSPQDMFASLTGNLNVTMAKGNLHFVNPAFFNTAIPAQTIAQEDMEVLSRAKTPITSLATYITIKNGIATSKDGEIILSAPQTIIPFSLQFDALRNILSTTLKLPPRNDIGQDGVRLNLEGAIQMPALTLSPQ